MFRDKYYPCPLAFNDLPNEMKFNIEIILSTAKTIFNLRIKLFFPHNSELAN